MKKIFGICVLLILNLSEAKAQQTPETFTTSVQSNIGIESITPKTLNQNSIQIVGSSGNPIKNPASYEFGIGGGTGYFYNNTMVGKFDILMKLSSTNEATDGSTSGFVYNGRVGADINNFWWDLSNLGYYFQTKKSFLSMSVSPIEMYKLRNMNSGMFAKGVTVKYLQDIGARFNLKAVGQIRALRAERKDNSGTHYNSGASRTAELKLQYLLGRKKTTVISAGAIITDQLIKSDENAVKNMSDTQRLISVGIVKVL